MRFTSKMKSEERGEKNATWQINHIEIIQIMPATLTNKTEFQNSTFCQFIFFGVCFFGSEYKEKCGRIEPSLMTKLKITFHDNTNEGAAESRLSRALSGCHVGRVQDFSVY